MKLGIYSLKKILFQGNAESVNVKTASGEITILDHHRPLISIVKPGTITVVDAAKKAHYIPVSSGFVEVTSSNQAKLIVDET